MLNKKMIAYLANPSTARLLLELLAKKQRTTKQLSEKFTDIPLPTLYRQIKKMNDDGILRVVETKPIRGAVEKTYAVTPAFTTNTEKMIRENDGELYMRMLTQYVMGIMSEFQEYTSRPNIDILSDGSGFSLVPVYATTEEIAQALQKVSDVLLQLYENTPDVSRKLHNICIITTPPKSENQ